MEEERTTQEQTPETPPEFGAQDYLNTLDAIKKNMVPVDKYNKLAEENRQLVQSLANGGGIQEEADVERESSEEIAKRLFAKSPKYRTDLAYFTDVLAYRDALIGEGGEDPFLPNNHEYVPSREDIERAQEIADALKECVEYADGDPSLFSNELKRRGVNIQTRRP